jgi:hypothetical protein
MGENGLRNLSPADVFVCLFVFFDFSKKLLRSLRYFCCVESPKSFASRVRQDTAWARVSSSRPLRSPSTNHTSRPLASFHHRFCAHQWVRNKWTPLTITGPPTHIALELIPSKWGSKWTDTPPTSARAP